MATRHTDELHEKQREAAKLMKRILIHFRAEMDEELRPYGVTKAQLQVLGAVRDAPGSSGAHLSRLCEVTPQTIQALLERAEEGGWIVRGKDSVNDRIITASLTPAGEELLSIADRIVKGIEARLWSGVPGVEIEALSRVLMKCLTNIASS